jgi:hypothetical protein
VNPATRLVFGANTFAWNEFFNDRRVQFRTRLFVGNNMGIAGGSYTTSTTF